jgi:hypothetical protein
MHPFNRRQFVFLSSGAVIGNMVVSGSASAQEDHVDGFDFSNSGLVTGEPKPLKHKSIPGFLSAEQIAPHHTAHYGGALKGYLGPIVGSVLISIVLGVPILILKI